MKVQPVCAILATLALTFAGRVMGEKERYIIILKEGATDEHIEEVIQTVEGHEGLAREELSVKSFNELLPMLFSTISEETANKVCLISWLISRSLWHMLNFRSLG